MSNVATQMILLPMTADISDAFRASEIKDKTGTAIGTSVGLAKRKDIATQLNLLGKSNKDALDAAILERTDAGFRHVKAQLNALGGDWTLHKAASRKLADGVQQITVVVREVKRKKGPSDEVMAAELGLTVDEVRQLRDAKAQKEAVVEVTETPTATAE